MTLAPNDPATLTAVVVELRVIGVGGNLGPGQWAAKLSVGAETKHVEGFDSLTTGDRMELTGAIAGLSALKRRCAVELHTDSQYLLQAALLLPAWKAAWSTDAKYAIRNQTLWTQLAAVAARHDVQWHGPKANGKDSDDFAVVATTHGEHEIRGRTVGEGIDVGYVYAGSILPWNESLGDYRAFTDVERQAEETCSNVGADASPPMTVKQARQTIIALAAHRNRLKTVPTSRLSLKSHYQRESA